MLVTKQLLVAIEFHSIFSHTMEVNGYRHLFGYILQNNLFCVQQKKETHTYTSTLDCLIRNNATQ